MKKALILFLNVFLICFIVSGCDKSGQGDLLIQEDPSTWLYESSEGYSIHINVYLFNKSLFPEESWKEMVEVWEEQIEHYQKAVNTEPEELRSLAASILLDCESELNMLKADWLNWSYVIITNVWLEHTTPVKFAAIGQYDNQPYDVIFTIYSEDMIDKVEVYEALRKIAIEMHHFSESDWKQLPYEDICYSDAEAESTNTRLKEFFEDQIFPIRQR